MRLSQEPRSFDVFFELQMRAERRQPVRPLFVFFVFGPFLRLKTPRIRWFPTDTLRKWNPRPACGTAIKSVRISMSVCARPVWAGIGMYIVGWFVDFIDVYQLPIKKHHYPHYL